MSVGAFGVTTNQPKGMKMNKQTRNKKPAPTVSEMIDLTPSWSSAFEAYMAVLESGTEEGKQIARKEFRRAGQLLDRLQKNQRERVASVKIGD